MILEIKYCGLYPALLLGLSVFEQGNYKFPLQEREQKGLTTKDFVSRLSELKNAVAQDHRENQSAEAAAINTVCKPRRPAGGFFVSEFVPISLTKPF